VHRAFAVNALNPPDAVTARSANAPPVGPPWDAPLADVPIAFVDLEFTGLDADRDRIVEVCVQRYRGAVLEASFTSLVNPEGEYTGPSMAIHQIAPHELALAPVFAQVWPLLLPLLNGAILIAHGARTDVAFLRAEVARMATPGHAQSDANNAREHAFLTFYLDTLNLSRRCFLLESHALSALCTHFNITRAQAHRAVDDVLALREVFTRVVDVLRPQTARDLWQVRVQQAAARGDILSAARLAAAGSSEVRVTYRPSGKKPVILRVFVASVSDDGTIVQCRDAVNFSRYALRASRVLVIEPPPA
jgi:DNA polymerase III subunit epsilon